MKYLTFDMIKQQLRLDDEQAQAEHDILDCTETVPKIRF